MDIFYKQQIDHIPQTTILYRNQLFQTSTININEQTRESTPTETLNDANKQADPIILHKHLSKNQTSDIQYVMQTTLGLISFQIMNPTFISLQSDPFLIRLKAPCHKKRAYHKKHRVKSFRFTGLQVIQQSNAYFYFQPSPHCRHIFREGRIRFRSHLSLRLTDAALCTCVYIRKGAYLGTLQPVLLSKYLKSN